MPDPLISFCVPAYNCDKYIEDMLECLCAQTYSNIEILVVNDGSTDQTEKKIAAFRDNRIRLISIENGGAARARNIAYQNAIGEYIIFFDADDLIGDEFVSSQLRALNNRSNCIAISAWGRFYAASREDFKLNDDLGDNDALGLEEWIVKRWLINQHNTPPGRLFIPRAIIEKAGLWNEELSLNDDFEFFTRVAINVQYIIPNTGAIYYYRSGIGGLSSQKGKDAYLSLFKSMQLSFDMVLAKFGQNILVKRSCANLWQAFIFEVYPLLRDKRSIAENNIRKLGGANLKYHAGGITKLLIVILGWKIVKRIKLLRIK